MTAYADDENDSGRQVDDGAEAQRRPLHERSIELTDPRAMRAYAHPVRMALIGLLRTQGPLTATQAAEQLGESSGTCSFHLRQLAKYGFCEEAGGGRGREKPWRATAMFTTWNFTPGDSDLSVPLTAAELERLRDDVQALLRPYLGRVTGEDEAPGDARRVELIQFAFPAPDAP